MKKLFLFSVCLLLLLISEISAQGTLVTDRASFEGMLDPASMLVDD